MLVFYNTTGDCLLELESPTDYMLEVEAPVDYLLELEGPADCLLDQCINFLLKSFMLGGREGVEQGEPVRPCKSKKF